MVRFISLWGLCLIFIFCQPALAQQGSAPVSVIIATVKIQAFADPIEALGTTKANENVVITADTTEKVAQIHFEDGQEVKAGDMLLTLDKSEEEAELRSAQALLLERQSAYDRAKDLQQGSALSKATLQQRLADLKQSQADIELIKARISKLIVTAPFDGILGLREVSVGTLVKPGDTITSINDLSQIKVDFDVPSKFLAVLKSGMPITGKVEAFGEKKFNGVVKTVNTQVDPVTRTITVRAVLPNPEGLLKPGLLMTITVFKEQRQSLVIPEETLVKRGEKNFVFIIQKQGDKVIARERQIEIGGRRPGEIEVMKGLNEGDSIITHGTVKVSNGAEVTIRAEEKSNEPLKALLQEKLQGAER